MIQSGLRSNDDITTHPAAVSLAKFCQNQFEQGMFDYMTLLVTMVTAGSSTSTLHVLNLLKETMAHMTSQVLCFFILTVY